MEQLLDCYASIVETNIESTKCLGNPINEPVNVVFDTDIGGDVAGRAAVGCDLALHLLAAVFAPAAEPDPGTLGRKHLGGRSADARGCAGDQDDLVAEALPILHHDHRHGRRRGHDRAAGDTDRRSSDAGQGRGDEPTATGRVRFRFGFVSHRVLRTTVLRTVGVPATDHDRWGPAPIHPPTRDHR